MVKLSPFYPYGGIPVPFSDGVMAECVPKYKWIQFDKSTLRVVSCLRAGAYDRKSYTKWLR